MKQFNPNKDYKCKVCKGGFKKRNSLDVYCSVKCRLEHDQKIRSTKLRSGILKCHKTISFVSAKNTFRTSDGERLTKFEINKRLKAKLIKSLLSSTDDGLAILQHVSNLKDVKLLPNG